MAVPVRTMGTTTLLRRNNRRVDGDSSKKNSQQQQQQLPLPLYNQKLGFHPRHKSSKRSTHLPLALCPVLFLVLVALIVGIAFLATSAHSSTTNILKNQAHNINSHDNRILQQHNNNAIQPVDGIYDVAVLGAGPAGLTAAIFAARAGLSVVVLGSQTGLLSETPRLDNFPSFATRTSGKDWLLATRDQAIQFGATFAMPGLLALSLQQEPIDVNAPASDPSNSVFRLPTQLDPYKAHSVIVATGATPRQLGLPKEDLLWGNTLHSCAICDGNLYKGKTVMVVGGGDAAMDAAIMLARQAKHVVLVHRRAEFRAKSKITIQLVQETSNIQILTPFVVSQWEVDQEDNLIGARIKGTKDDGEQPVIPCDGAFILIGATPNTDWLVSHENSAVVDLDEDGLIKIQKQDGRTTSSLPGVFAAGEVTDNVYKQAITAAAAGAQAALDAERWLRQSRGVDAVNQHQKQPIVVIRKEEEEEEEEVSRDEVSDDNDQSKTNCDLTKQNCILEIVKTHLVVVFEKPWCPYCRKALEALGIAGLTEESSNLYIIDVTEHLDQMRAIQNTLKSLTGRRTVPNVFVAGNSIGGGDETALMHRQGKLKPLLESVGAILPATATKDSEADSGATDVENELCDLTTQECILSIAKAHPVLLFSLKTCPECVRMLELLSMVGVSDPYIIDLKDHREISQNIRYELVKLSGTNQVPNLFIGGESIGRYRDAQKLHDAELLIPKLEAAKAIQ